jgi:hypothetical protein
VHALLQLDQSAPLTLGPTGLYYEGANGSPGWMQYGKLDLTLQDSQGTACAGPCYMLHFAKPSHLFLYNLDLPIIPQGIMMEMGNWVGYGDVTINTDMPDSGVHTHNPLIHHWATGPFNLWRLGQFCPAGALLT